jgi:hypothetical protein
MYSYEDRIRAVELYIKFGNASGQPKVSMATQPRMR